MRVLSVCLLVISTSACMAQPPNNTPMEKIDCTVIRNSLQLDNCVHKNMMSSNAQLLSEMTSFEKRAKKIYKPDPALGKELIDKVRSAQKAWLSYRQKNCSVEAFEVQEGTAAYITTVNNCIIHMNVERTKVLKKLLQ